MQPNNSSITIWKLLFLSHLAPPLYTEIQVRAKE